MKCDDVMELMQRHLDLDLTESEEQALSAHLQGCPDCADLFERLKLLSCELAQLPKVTPPYSIVDSILPRLEGLGGITEPGAAADPAAPPVSDEVTVRREKKGLISWKIVSGVAAAGLVLGMFIFNGGNGRNDLKSAEELLQPKQSEKSAALAGSVDPDDGTGKPGPEKNGGSTSPQETQAASGGAGKTVDPTKPAATSATPAVGGPQQKSLTKDGGQTNKDGQGGATAKVPSDSANVGRATNSAKPLDPSAAAPTGHPGLADSTEQPAGIPEMTFSANDFADSNTDPTGQDKREFGLAPIIPPGTEGEGAPKIGLRGFAPPAASSIKPVTSPDGEYTASLSNDSVTITDKSGSVVFTSGVKLVPGDTLIFGGWTEDSQFTYTIQPSAGKGTTYRISAAEHKESIQ